MGYATGLRASEVSSLKVGDVDSQRMTLRVEQGKGSKDRHAFLRATGRYPTNLNIPGQVLSFAAGSFRSSEPAGFIWTTDEWSPSPLLMATLTYQLDICRVIA